MEDICQIFTRQRIASRIYKVLKKKQKTNKSVHKCVTELKRHFSNEELQMANAYMKKCSTSLAVQRNANQTNTEIPSHPSQEGCIKKTKAGKHVRIIELLFTDGGSEIIPPSHYINQYGGSSK
jgi:hypothetical protein